MKKLLVFLVITFLSIGDLWAQKNLGPNDTLTVFAIVHNGDTMQMRWMEEVGVSGKMTKAQQAAAREYNRLRNAVYVTYPYARNAGVIMNDINMRIAGADKETRKAYIRSREKDLRKDFTKPLTDLSVYQGKVLMKLINRETGNNCYEILKEYKGGFMARTYQTIAFFFDSNLKQDYNPTEGTDATIEKFVKEVQRMYGYQEVAKVTAAGANTAQ